MTRYIEPDNVREDPPDDPPEDFAHSIHTCGWNGSRALFKREVHRADPCPPDVRARLMAARELHLQRAAEQRARGLCL
jgi:hypothetical protein